MTNISIIYLTHSHEGRLLKMETGYFPTSTGLNVFYRYWPAKKKGGSLILCIHGLAGDSRIFGYLASKLSDLGHDIYAADLPGYGNSDGEKGDVAFDTTMQALHDVVTWISNKHGNQKIFLLGFSLGGLHALWYASLHQEMLNGIIALAPHLRITRVKRDPRSEPSRRLFFKALIRYFVTPSNKDNLSKAVPSAFGELAGDEWVYMMKDPTCDFNYSYRYIFNVLIGKAEKVDALYKIKIPILILHGSKDWNVVPEQSEVFLNRVDSNDRELKIFDCDHWFYHTLFYKQESKYSEVDRMNVVKTIIEWIQKTDAVLRR